MDQKKGSPVEARRSVPAHVGRALVCSLAGLGSAWRHEMAFRMEVVLFVLLAPLAIWLGETGAERAVLFGSLVLVLLAELVNSAVEAVVDRISDERHHLSKRAKDQGSAAVFVCLVNVPISWGLVLGPRLSGG